jgi:hypothetical protein
LDVSRLEAVRSRRIGTRCRLCGLVANGGDLQRLDVAWVAGKDLLGDLKRPRRNNLSSDLRCVSTPRSVLPHVRVGEADADHVVKARVLPKSALSRRNRTRRVAGAERA